MASQLIWQAVIRAEHCVIKAYYRPNQAYPTYEGDSQLVHYLKSFAWVPDKSGEFRRPQNMTRDELRTDFLYDDRNGLLTAIGFGEQAKNAAKTMYRKIIRRKIWGSSQQRKLKKWLMWPNY